MNTDPEFFPESDTTSTTSGDTASIFEFESSCQHFDDIDDDDDDDSVQSITPDEYAELTLTAYEIMEEYINLNILSLSSPQFYSNMVDYTTELLYMDIQCSTVNEPDIDMFDSFLIDELHEFIEQTAEIWKDVSQIPRRSIQLCNDDIERKTQPQILQMNAKITALQSIPQPEQKTREWYEFRYNLITASNLWKVFGTQSQINSLIYEKCKPNDLDQHESRNTYTEGPMHWGVKYEPVTIQIYEDMFNTTVGDFGCIPHPNHQCIGASPDGINIDPKNKRYGRMLEIKNIVNREITGIPKEEYWIQTQIQMETCDLEECDFVETRFKEYENEGDFYHDDTHTYRGLFLHFIQRPPTIITEHTQLSNKPYYVYMPLRIPLNYESIQLWIDEQRSSMLSENKVLFAQKYWFLDEISCVLIPRNKSWFSRAVPQIQSIWDTIVKERIDGYEHRASKKRATKDRSMSIMSDDGLPMKNNKLFCLIRLDEDGNVW